VPCRLSLRRPAVWLAAALIASFPALAASPPGAGYHSFAEVERQLKAWDARPEVELSTIGRSAGGRALYVARLAAPGGTDPDRRPAVFVGANIAGFHNAGTEAALHLIETLLAGEGEARRLLAERTFYVAPALNPDAHDGMFGKVRRRLSGNQPAAAERLDRDRDGLLGEDGPDDLDGDGRITWLRIPDAAGEWLAHPDEPRLLVKADASKGQAGAYRRVSEGRDDDGDGVFNEDGAEGVAVDRNFPHAYPYPEPEAGPWPSSAPEAKALLDFLLARQNVAVAVVYGPANNLLAAPQSLGGGGDLGSLTFKVPRTAAEFIGLDPEQEYTLDQVWEVVKDLPFARQNNLTKEQVAQFLGAGPATKVEADDQAVFDQLAEAYKERLKGAGLDVERPAAQYGRGGFTPWLYYQAGVLALELDVWGIPKAAAPTPAAGDKAEEKPLTVEGLAAMTSEQFLALGEEKIAAFLEENKVPAEFNAQRVMAAIKGGQLDPAKMAQMIRQGGGGTAPAGAAGKAGKGGGGEREREVLAWLDANAPGSVAPWTAVNLSDGNRPDGTRAEAGGIDPFAEVAPPAALLAPALAAHTTTVLDLAGRIARLEILALEATDLGGGVWRVRAVAGNRGELPTHTKMAERSRARLPVRLALASGENVHLVTGQPVQVTERLAPGGTLAAEWLVRAPRGARITVEAFSEHAGTAARSLTLGTPGKEDR